MKNLKIKLFFKKTKFSLRCPDYNIFRLLKLNSFKNKKVLDIGYGNGENLIEFDRRGATTYGISLVNNAKYIKKFLSNYKENNYCHRDLNKNSLIKCLEKMKIIQNIGGGGGGGEQASNQDLFDNAFDIIICTDTIYYINKLKYFFIEISKILKRDGLFLFQYIEGQYRPNFNNFDIKNLHSVGNINNYKSYKKYSNNKNPIIFLKNKIIKKFILESKLLYITSTFNYNTYTDCKNNIFLHKNIYILLKKVL